jgi:hypothetical protein
MNNSAKKRWYIGASILMVLASIYCGLAILQAASPFTGERALHNLYFWGYGMCTALVAALVFGVLAYRLRQDVGGGRGAA